MFFKIELMFSSLYLVPDAIPAGGGARQVSPGGPNAVDWNRKLIHQKRRIFFIKISTWARVAVAGERDHLRPVAPCVPFAEVPPELGGGGVAQLGPGEGAPAAGHGAGAVGPVRPEAVDYWEGKKNISPMEINALSKENVIVDVLKL